MQQSKVPGRVLVVDDDPSIREGLFAALDSERYAVQTAADGGEALEVAATSGAEVILLDLGLPDVEGLDLIPRFREMDETTAIVVLTATSKISVVVRAMRLGADNFLVKPVSLETLDDILDHTLRDVRRERQHRALLTRSALSEAVTIVGDSRAMKRVKQLLAQVADTEATVLLTGESGTGKGLVAEEVHRQSHRASGPFVDLNCAAMSPTLLESELFGHEQGAFTDARRAKQGLFEIASGGTVFLDEIGEMPLEIQSKVLKFLEDRKFRRVGGVRDLTADVRLIAATNRDLKDMVRAGAFRQDLYYRMNVFAIPIPPLRERAEDIMPLAHYFLGQLNRAMGMAVSGFDSAATEAMAGYIWPGNARELRNVVERAVILSREGLIRTHHLPSDLHQPALRNNAARIKPLSEVECAHIIDALEATAGNIKRSAEILGISRTTLYNKIKAHQIAVPS
jgi:two-component system response regulator AtoC